MTVPWRGRAILAPPGDPMLQWRCARPAAPEPGKTPARGGAAAPTHPQRRSLLMIEPSSPPQAIPDPAPQPVHLRINGRPYDLAVPTHQTLLDTLRDTLGLTGTKKV